MTGEYLEVPIFSKKGTFTTKISLEDSEKIRGLKLHVLHTNGKCYANSSFKVNGKWRRKSLSHILTDALPGSIVDHINGDSMDNRRENLRFSNASFNQMNKRGSSKISQYKGIGFIKVRSRWCAHIKAAGKNYSCGWYKSEHMAALGYDKASMKHHGEHGLRNFPDDIVNYIISLETQLAELEKEKAQ